MFAKMLILHLCSEFSPPYDLIPTNLNGGKGWFDNSFYRQHVGGNFGRSQSLLRGY